MKKTLTAVAMAASVILAPAAAAAPSTPLEPWEEEYLVNISNVGIYPKSGDHGDLLDAGYAICMALRSGYSAESVAKEIFYSSNESADGVTRQQSNMIVAFAQVSLCPSAGLST